MLNGLLACSTSENYVEDFTMYAAFTFDMGNGVK